MRRTVFDRGTFGSPGRPLPRLEEQSSRAKSELQRLSCQINRDRETSSRRHLEPPSVAQDRFNFNLGTRTASFGNA